MTYSLDHRSAGGGFDCDQIMYNNHMMDNFLSFLLTCIIIELTPGPNMAYLTALSSAHGKKAGFSMVAGIAAGLFMIGLIAAFGAATLVVESPTLYHSLRWAGVFYLVWLAWDNWRATDRLSALTVNFDMRSFRRGFITNILNPKAMMFYVTVFPAFIDTGRPILGQFIFMTVIYVSIATFIHGVIAILGDLAGFYLRNPRAMKIMRYVFSLLLLGIAVWFALSTGSDL